MFDWGTSLVVIEIIPSVEFQQLFHDSLFHTSSEYINASENATITYYLNFSTEACVFGSLTELKSSSGTTIGLLNSKITEGTPEKYLADPSLEKVNITPSSTFSQELATVFTEASAKHKTTANSYFITRENTETSTELLLISDGVTTTMFADVFASEMKRTLTPSFYDDSSTLPQNTGLGMGIIQANLIQYSSNNDVLVSFDIQNINTESQFINFYTSLPLIGFDTLPENIYTYTDELGDTQSVPAYLTVNFGYQGFEVTDRQLRDLRNPALIIFTCDEDYKPKKLIAAADIRHLRGISDKIYANLDIKLILGWDELLII